VFAASGRATFASYVINERPHPAWDGSYAIALVDLDEGPRMMTNIIADKPSVATLLSRHPASPGFKFKSG
jgi:uncharacterized OB-fold protein|tara:strand:- start:1000 stop:1209 length:210 start_codon:yes stop_codon:yes gene_type:complete